MQWSFGITCWEIFSLRLESYSSVDVLQMTNYLKGGGTLEQPPLCSDEMYVVGSLSFPFNTCETL